METLTHQEWEKAAPGLHATASAGLGWWKLRHSDLAATAVGDGLRDAFRLQTLHARIHERRLIRALGILEAAGIRSVLAKGWSVARRYPSPGLRPYGDLDLHVAPEDHAAAAALLRAHEKEGLGVDLHRGVASLGRPWADVAKHSVATSLETSRVWVLGPEDHLALLCVHLLSHGAWRPLWLCDVALFLEELPPDLDWTYLQSLPPRQVEEIRLVALLAQRLLGADLSRTPWRSHQGIPRWLAPAVLDAWGLGGHYSLTTPIALSEADPRRFLESVRVRWPNPVEATVRWRAPYNSFPRWPFQLLDAVVRGGRALASAPRVVARRLRRRTRSDEGGGR
ncbi:MAG TPA: nucleotidyltransferase family protein [Longimicrobiales bacterium]|nr:nucleotidyltransferase family protein [Longimicrobiales bacterium]